MSEETKEVLSFDTMQIMEMIPHRFPFLLVDRITECVPGKYAKGYKNLTMNEQFSKVTSQEIQLCQGFYNLKLWLNVQHQF